MHTLVRLRQPLPKNEPVQRPQHKPLGATRRRRDHAHMGWLQTILLKMTEGAGTGVDAQSFHAHDCRKARYRKATQRNATQWVRILSGTAALSTPKVHNTRRHNSKGWKGLKGLRRAGRACDYTR